MRETERVRSEQLARILRVRDDPCSLLGYDILGYGGTLDLAPGTRSVADVVDELSRRDVGVDDPDLRLIGVQAAVAELRASGEAEVRTGTLTHDLPQRQTVTLHLTPDGTDVVTCWVTSSLVPASHHHVAPRDAPSTVGEAAVALGGESYEIVVLEDLDDELAARLMQHLGSRSAAYRGHEVTGVRAGRVEYRSEVDDRRGRAPRAGYVLVVERRTRPGEPRHGVLTEVLLLNADPLAQVSSATFHHLGVDWRPPDPPPRRRDEPLDPWRLQLHLDLACADEVELGAVVRRLLDGLVDGWRELAGADPVEDPDVWFAWAVTPRDAPTRGSKRLGRSTRSAARLREILDGGTSGGVIGWRWVGARDGVFRPKVDLSVGTYAGPEETYVAVELQLLPEPPTEMIHRAEGLLVDLLLRTIDAGAPVRFASLTDDSENHDTTAYEAATAITSLAGRRAGGRWLRSYSWVTYVPPDLARVLDEAGTLTVRVHEVRRLPDDRGLLVRSTAHLADHVGDHVAALRRALDPLLDPRPTRTLLAGRTSGLRVVWDDGSVGPLDHGRLEFHADRLRRG